MVREDQILPAAVNIDRLPQIATRHGGALDVPARAPLPPRGFPARLAGLGSLPEGEIHRILFQLPNIDARTGLQLLKRLVGELAVLLKFGRAEVDIPLYLIGITLLNQGGDDGNDLINILRSAGMDSGLPDIEPLGIRPVFLNILFRHLGERDPLLVRTADDLIVHIGEVLDKVHLQPAVLQVPAQHVKNAQRARVADVDKIVDRGAAGIDFNRIGLNGF